MMRGLLIMKHTIIDFVSVTWTPVELGQVLALAKQRAKLKATRRFEIDQNFKKVSCQALDTGAIDYGAAVRAKLNDDFEIGADSRKYHEVKRDLLDHFGLNILDSLCRGEVERFINLINHALTQPGNVWEYSMCRGGFSGYPHSAKVLVNGQQAGLCAWGAKNHGCYFSLSGVGTAVIDTLELHEALKQLPGAKITRLDIAYDSLKGKQDVKLARRMATSGDYCSGGRPASYCYIESGHLSKLTAYVKNAWRGRKPKTESLKKRYGFIPDKGRSFYVGSRESGKLLRVYEKGKQLKDKKHSKWVRWELELRANSRDIPFDALKEPSKYMAGAYPALAFINVEEQCVIATHKRKWFTSIDNAIDNGATQSGKLINFMKQCLGMSDSNIVSVLTRHLDISDIPDRLNRPVFVETAASKKIELEVMRLINPDSHDIYSLAQ